MNFLPLLLPARPMNFKEILTLAKLSFFLSLTAVLSVVLTIFGTTSGRVSSVSILDMPAEFYLFTRWPFFGTLPFSQLHWVYFLTKNILLIIGKIFFDKIDARHLGLNKYGW